MKFRSVDLLFVTTWVAGVLASQHFDLALFRQLLMITFVVLLAALACWGLRHGLRLNLTGAIAGSLGALTYVFLAFFLIQEFYGEFETNFVFAPDPRLAQWYQELTLAPLLGGTLGAAVGPMILSYWDKAALSRPIRKSRMYSALLLLSLFILIVVSALDRAAFASRVWWLPLGALLFFYAGFTIKWTYRWNRKRIAHS